MQFAITGPEGTPYEGDTHIYLLILWNAVELAQNNVSAEHCAVFEAMLRGRWLLHIQLFLQGGLS
eukprot:SAG11_NODE_5108_length_1662_cov_1.230326_2_plen_65_part_00